MVNPRADSVSSRVSASLKNTILLIAFIVQSQPGQARIHALSDANLDVRFDDRTLTATVTDKRCGAVWEPLPLEENLTLKNVHEDENGLTVRLTGKVDLEVEITLTPQSDPVYTISSKGAAAFEELRFPPAFKTPDPNHSVVYTDCEACLLPVNDARFGTGRNRIYTRYQGLTMAWIGMTDGNQGKGYRMILFGRSEYNDENRVVQPGGYIL